MTQTEELATISRATVSAGFGGLSPRWIEATLASAIEKGSGVETLERLLNLSERIEAKHAAAVFAEDFAEFQRLCPPIKKNKEAPVSVTRSGAKYGGYLYATLDEIARTVAPILGKLGFSYSFDTDVTEAMLLVTCTLRHRGGHAVTSRFSAPTEAVTQAMSPQQRIANAQTYGRRYSLISVLGLSTADPDEDGAPDPATLEAISATQVEELEALLDKRPDGSRRRFLEYYQVATLEELTVGRFDDAKRRLLTKIKEEGGGG